MLLLLCSLTCSPSARSRIWWIYDCCTLSTQINMLNILVVSSLSNLTQCTFDVTCLVLFIMRKSLLTSRKKQTNDTCNYKNEKGITVMLFFNYNFFRKGLLQRCLVPYIKKNWLEILLLGRGGEMCDKLCKVKLEWKQDTFEKYRVHYNMCAFLTKHEVKMAGYWPCPSLCTFTDSHSQGQ